MVKNTNGGKKSKGFARKHLVGGGIERVLRLSACDFEKYGVVTRILGNGMFYVVTDIADNKQPQLLGHIRNKFKGRSKRDNNIELGSVVLVGLRDWETPNFKNCDLLEVYDANDVKQLIKTPSIDLSSIQKHIDLYGKNNSDNTTNTNDIEFSENIDTTIPTQDSEIPTTIDLHNNDNFDDENFENFENFDDL
jgi:translation initiation factor IF-1